MSPGDRGLEQRIAEKLEQLRELDKRVQYAATTVDPSDGGMMNTCCLSPSEAQAAPWRATAGSVLVHGVFRRRVRPWGRCGERASAPSPSASLIC